METPLSSQSSSVDTESEILTEIEGEEATINKFNSPEETRDLKLKELPLVHQSKKKSESGSTSEDSVNDDRPWITGGPLGSKNAVLVFRCSALSNPPSDPPANELHMTYKTIQAETKLLAAVLGAHGMREVHPSIPDFNLLWTGIHPKPQMLKGMTPYQRVNHFPRSYELTRKDRLYKNIERMQHAKGSKHFDFIPQTFVMPVDFRDLCSAHYRSRGPWIVKPVASSRGRGIFIINNPDQVPLEETVVVAKYIDNPLLVDGHKCDLRLYVLVTSYDPLIVYMYEEGLVRFATVKYDANGKNLWNPCMHLCNYSINKYHSDYKKSDDPEAENVGHKWTLSALLRHLREEGTDTALLMSRIEEVVVKAILASAAPIVSACRMFVPHSRNCFELYGFDILIDSLLKPWLLEVNLSPSLGCDSPLDVRVKSAMLADLLTLVGLPTVDPMARRAHETRRPNGPVDILKKLSCRRVQSADALANGGGKKITSTSSSRLASSSLTLSPEESRIVRSARAEFERRGGFVRIFPSPESWKRYGNFLDPITGIASTTSSLNGQPYPLLLQRNYNLLLHQQLFPELRTMSISTPDRLNRYERALLQGHRSSLDDRPTDRLHSDKPEADGSDVEDVPDIKVVFKEMLLCLENGNRLSQFQARKLFGQYLVSILKRLSSHGRSGENDDQSELILRFLQRASGNLRTPYFVQIPSRKLIGKDRVAVVAKQLNDFIYLYNRETELYTEGLDRPNYVPSQLFQQFISVARESELEEVLSAHTKLYKCAHIYLGHSGAGLMHPLSLLRSFPPTSFSREDCNCKKTLPRLRDRTATTHQSSALPSPAGPSKKLTAKVSRAL
ncbi:tubulin polyglutamylase TTLL5 [Anabrus simplex]|uniref:tubulin polyglutamylase TTLL5 n=1 Tax=Anabrus simplex TaxID=316456 RepID=UPI0034DD0DC6